MTRAIRLLILSFALALTALCPLTTPVRAAGGGQGSQTCPSSGSQRIVTTSTRAVDWTIQAPSANTGKVYIGFSSAVTTSTGIYLNAGDSFTKQPAGNAASRDLSQVYIACTQSADTITYVYEQ